MISNILDQFVPIQDIVTVWGLYKTDVSGLFALLLKKMKIVQR